MDWQLVESQGQRALRGEGSGVVALFGLGPRRRVDRESQLRRLATAAGFERLAWCQQVHGRSIVDALEAEGGAPEADGMISATAGLGLAIVSADCVPILASAPAWVAAVHAGWRGAAAGIVEEMVELASNPGALRVFLGPSIGACCYQVGGEVIDALERSVPERSLWLWRDRVDLREHLRARLEALGVDSIERVGGCTRCDPTLASYRRDGDEAGRQISLIALS